MHARRSIVAAHPVAHTCCHSSGSRAIATPSFPSVCLCLRPIRSKYRRRSAGWSPPSTRSYSPSRPPTLYNFSTNPANSPCNCPECRGIGSSTWWTLLAPPFGPAQDRFRCSHRRRTANSWPDCSRIASPRTAAEGGLAIERKWFDSSSPVGQLSSARTVRAFGCVIFGWLGGRKSKEVTSELQHIIFTLFCTFLRNNGTYGFCNSPLAPLKWPKVLHFFIWGIFSWSSFWSERMAFTHSKATTATTTTANIRGWDRRIFTFFQFFTPRVN